MIRTLTAVVVSTLLVTAPVVADEASGLPTGKRQHRPASTDAATGLPTGKREHRKAPDDAASGLPTGKRQHSSAPRDAATGLPTGKRQHQKAPDDAATGLPTGKRQHLRTSDDAATGLPTGKRQHTRIATGTPTVDADVRRPMQDIQSTPGNEPAGMNKAELTESVAQRPSSTNGNGGQRGKNRDAKKAARERAKEVAAGNSEIHQPGHGQTGATRQRGKRSDDVAKKTDKSEAARSKKKD